MNGMIFLEVFLCFLLIGVMVYAFILNKHLVVLRAGQDDFKSLMSTFNHAINHATQITQALKRVAGAEQEKLAEKIQSSHKMCEELEFLIGRAEALLRTLEKKVNKRDTQSEQFSAQESTSTAVISSKIGHSGRTDIQRIESSQNDEAKIFKTLQKLR